MIKHSITVVLTSLISLSNALPNYTKRAEIPLTDDSVSRLNLSFSPSFSLGLQCLPKAVNRFNGLLGLANNLCDYAHSETVKTVVEIPAVRANPKLKLGENETLSFGTASGVGGIFQLDCSAPWDPGYTNSLNTMNLNHPPTAVGSISVFRLQLASQTTQTKKAPTQATEIANIDRYSAELDRFVKRNEKSARIFADVSSGTTDEKANWKQFKNEKEREKADTGENLNENAYVWTRAGKVVAVNFTFQSPSRDWAHFVMYFFRDDGSLAKIHGQLNTFYGDLSIIRDHYYSRDGKLLKTKKQFLDLQTQKPKKPGEYQDTPEPVFKNVSELPFFKLL